MIIPIHAIFFTIQNLLNFLNILVIINDQVLNHQIERDIPPLPDIANLLLILISGLKVIIEAYEENRKIKKAHILIQYLRGYR